MADPIHDAAQAVCTAWEKTWGKTNVVELENTMAPLIEALNAAALAARAQPTNDDDRQAIYNDVKTELGMALGWNDSDPDEARDWRHDLVERVLFLALDNGRVVRATDQPSEVADP